ncbi:N-acetyltransferase, putative [Candida dubliniensis CD36]|uniref:N-acetyltransferase, putative n=1 Tax=Candida dubliniensis (strain CD36 / ATCC MYA-646 / CBS 7987 / NCPF 3949 / NRRL Y-17841) TaxID=573826 RepID=B9WIA1_CANDC|nr:N-acetyltransferase, putative [Candida dubliniensis CD36]CAX40963.1 N-acetyltransferase, putative [Candida dubliniensis CD36]
MAHLGPPWPTSFFFIYPPPMSFTIRPIEEKDKPEWLHLWTSYIEFYNSLDKITPEISSTTFARFLDADEPVYSVVAVDSTSKIIGFANYLTHRNTWTIEDALYLNDLFVSSENRLHGVGRKLIEYIYTEADRLNCKKCYWSTQFENHRAQLLYTKVGVKSGFLLYRRP